MTAGSVFPSTAAIYSGQHLIEQLSRLADERPPGLAFEVYEKPHRVGGALSCLTGEVGLR